MPKKKRTPAYKKYAAPRYPKAVREAAKDLAVATRARKIVGNAAFGKPGNSKPKRDYKKVDAVYQKAGRKLAKLTGYTWKTRRK
jgi:hypothetical protein